METKIDKNNKTICIYNDEGERILSVFLFDNHAAFVKNGDEDIILDSSNPSAFYENLRNLFDNEYSFVRSSGNQAKNLIEFFSDELHPVNGESLKDFTERSSLVLRLDDDTNDIIIRVDNPANIKGDENNKRKLVFLNSDAQNTFRAYNDITMYESETISLQKDIIEAINNSFKSKSYLPKRFKRNKLKKTA